MPNELELGPKRWKKWQRMYFSWFAFRCELSTLLSCLKQYPWTNRSTFLLFIDCTVSIFLRIWEKKWNTTLRPREHGGEIISRLTPLPSSLVTFGCTSISFERKFQTIRNFHSAIQHDYTTKPRAHYRNIEFYSMLRKWMIDFGKRAFSLHWGSISLLLKSENSCKCKLRKRYTKTSVKLNKKYIVLNGRVNPSLPLSKTCTTQQSLWIHFSL